MISLRISDLFLTAHNILYPTMKFGVNAFGNNTRPLTCVQFRIHWLLVRRVSAWPVPCPAVGQTDPLIEVLQFAFSLFQSCLFQVIPPIGQDYLVRFQSAEGLSLELITICRCIKCTLYFIIHDINKNHKIVPDSGCRRK